MKPTVTNWNWLVNQSSTSMKLRSCNWFFIFPFMIFFFFNDVIRNGNTSKLPAYSKQPAADDESLETAISIKFDLKVSAANSLRDSNYDISSTKVKHHVSNCPQWSARDLSGGCCWCTRAVRRREKDCRFPLVVMWSTAKISTFATARFVTFNSFFKISFS